MPRRLFAVPLAALGATAILSLVGCGTGASGTSGASDASGHVYWVSSGVGAAMTVNTVPLAGGHVTTLARGKNGPAAVALQGTHVYWVNQRDGTVNEVPLGGGRVTVLARGQNEPASVAADGRYVYWVDSGKTTFCDHCASNAGSVNEVPLGGGPVTTLARDQNHPVSIAVDSSHVYWVDEYDVSAAFGGENRTGTVNEVPLGGGRVTTLARRQELPTSVAVDSSHVYWVNGGGCPECGSVKAVPLGGGDATTLARGQTTPISVAVNDGHVYWIGQVLGTMNEVPVGGGRVTTLARGQNGPTSLAVDGTHVYWVNHYDGTVNEIPVGGGRVITLARGQNGPASVTVGPDDATRPAGTDPQGAIRPGSTGSKLPTGMIGSIGQGPTGRYGPTGDYGPVGSIGQRTGPHGSIVLAPTGPYVPADVGPSPFNPLGQNLVTVPRIGPILLSSTGLAAEARLIGQRVYWAGPREGFSYEFTRDTRGDVYVRYLPKGVRNGAPGSQFLIVATYPFDSAYGALKQSIYGETPFFLPGRSLIYATPDDPKSALIAFRGDCPKSTWGGECGPPYQVEVYDPARAVSARVAVEAGQIQVKPID